MKYIITALLTFLLIAVTAQSALSLIDEKKYYVSPTGSDSNSGSPSLPFRTIQKALNVAQPGDTVNLMSGEYRENIKSVRDGTSDRPITIKGDSNVILRSGGSGNRIFEINHDYIYVRDFTVDGLVKEGDTADDYADKLIYVQGTDSGGVKGLKILNMKFKNAGGEALRLRYFIRNAEVAYSTFENIGVYDFKFNGGGKNGEAIYLGTSSNQWADGKNPTSDADVSANNRIHHNYFNTQGNEC
ncbi:MAG: DUF1565 domain-containing protein, partial [Nanoarchaeota archaeon]|nr:DUF1565 domain-containing protein [Nanoarchaeota archaeon]